jgi:hypothetical protein
MIYVPRFMKIGPGIQKLIWGIHRKVDYMCLGRNCSVIDMSVFRRNLSELGSEIGRKRVTFCGHIPAEKKKVHFCILQNILRFGAADHILFLKKYFRVYSDFTTEVVHDS